MGNFLWGIHHVEFPIESPWRIHRESDSPGILHEFPNLPGAKNLIPQGEYPMENYLVMNSCE